MKTLEYIKEKIKENENKLFLLNSQIESLENQKQYNVRLRNDITEELELDFKIIEFINKETDSKVVLNGTDSVFYKKESTRDVTEDLINESIYKECKQTVMNPLMENEKEIGVTTLDSSKREFIMQSDKENNVQKPPLPLTWNTISSMDYNQLSDIVKNHSLPINLEHYDETHGLDVQALKIDIADLLELVIPKSVKK